MKIAVVTGASYGIGKAIAEKLLADGWKVYVLSRSQPTIASEHCVWIKCDLGKTEQIKTCLETITEPRIDALISNAGVIKVENASEVSQESYQQTFSVNVLAPMLIVNALRDKISNGIIISVSSVSDRIPGADIALYCSSKAANTLYFNSLADELKNAKVITLLPSYVETPMLHGTIGDDANFEWNATIKPKNIADLVGEILAGNLNVASGSNIILVTDQLKDDLQSVEKLYGYNVTSNKLARL
jgi:NAD(P)-dependent dehydrogenase (short-subunit alcohol dehydrogenase family)